MPNYLWHSNELTRDRGAAAGVSVDPRELRADPQRPLPLADNARIIRPRALTYLGPLAALRAHALQLNPAPVVICFIALEAPTG